MFALRETESSREQGGTFSSVQLLSRVQLFATHGLQHARPPCPSPTPGVYSNSCLLSRWCHPTISSSVIPFPPTLPSPESSSVQFSCSVVSDSLRPHGLQHARLPCPPPTPEAYSNSCPLSQWCHATVSSYVIPFSSHLQSFWASGSFPISQFFASGGQSIRVSASASALPVIFRTDFL